MATVERVTPAMLRIIAAGNRGRFGETSLAQTLDNAAASLEQAEGRAKFFSDQSRRYYAALRRIAEFTGDVDGAGPIAREALLNADENERT